MVFLVPVVTFVVLVAWLLRRQIKAERPWAGWMIISLVFLFLTTASYLLAKYDVTTFESPMVYQFDVVVQEGDLNDQTIGGELGKKEASFEAAYERTTKELYGFGTLCIEFSHGNRYIPLEFDETGNLVGSPEAMPFAAEIQQVIQQVSPGITFTGQSVNYTEMEQIKDTRLKKKDNSFHGDFFLFSMLRFQTITIFLIGYYLFALKRMRDKGMRNTDSIRILDL